jgi:hypothetical protein
MLVDHRHMNKISYSTVAPNPKIEQLAKEKWSADAALRNEFCNDFDSFLAFENAQSFGLVRLLGNPECAAPKKR